MPVVPQTQPGPAPESTPPEPQAFWAQVLSGDPARIRDAVSTLSEDELAAVLDHLRRMAADPGWHLAQRHSARRALESLGVTLPSEDV